MKEIIIAVDIMGGDHGPATTIEALDLASKVHPNILFRLFGNKDQAIKELKKYKHFTKYEIVHTTQEIKSNHAPVDALRKLKSSSLRLAINDVNENRSDGVVSAGNTGALMAISKFVLKTIPGITRPAIAGIMPTLRGENIILDLGANVECSHENLVEFAIMGEIFSKLVLNKNNPKVGLLNVGSEEIKGNTTVKRTFEELENLKLGIDFYGFIEGNDINKGVVDVVVTDGFSGNIALKTAEGVAELILSFLKKSYNSSFIAKLGYLLSKPALNRFKARIDPRKYNGAILLGLNGIVVKSHGSTDSFGFSNAISVAVGLVENKYNDVIKEKLKQYSSYSK